MNNILRLPLFPRVEAILREVDTTPIRDPNRDLLREELAHIIHTAMEVSLKKVLGAAFTAEH
ncbi:MAG: hypothetical protein JSW20_01710 [Nitrospiraceae bacterium]|nr:MAG: hypothetical protein JSW20_01710 [Nitrospiraceae bacterium]